VSANSATSSGISLSELTAIRLAPSSTRICTAVTTHTHTEKERERERQGERGRARHRPSRGREQEGEC
jgi:hypothetical protein